MNNTSPFSEKVIRLVRYPETQGHYNLGMFNNKEKNKKLCWPASHVLSATKCIRHTECYCTRLCTMFIIMSDIQLIMKCCQPM